MSYFLILCTLFISIQSKGTELKSRLANALNELDINNQKSVINQCSTSEEDENFMLERCALDLCGIPNKYKTPFLSEATAGKYVEEEKLKQIKLIEVKLEELIRFHLQKKSNNLAAIKKNLDGNTFTDNDLQFLKNSLKEYSNKSDTEIEKVAKHRLREGIYELENKINSPDLIESQMNYCRSALMSKSLKLPEDKVLAKIFKSTKKDFISSVVKEMFATDTKRSLKKYLKKNVSVSSQENDLDKSIDEIRSSYSTLKSVPITLNAVDPQSEMIQIIVNKEYGNLNPLSDFYLCPHMDSVASNDKFISKDWSQQFDPQSILKNDTIFISEYSCSHRTGGKEIISHELGHAISHYMSKNNVDTKDYNTYLKLRECASSQYQEKQEASIFHATPHKGDSLKTEEDTADLFAFMITKEENELLGCYRLQPNHDFSGYRNLNLESHNSGHSTSLFRLLNETFQKGRLLPESCMKALNPSKIKFKKCL